MGAKQPLILARIFRLAPTHRPESLQEKGDGAALHASSVTTVNRVGISISISASTGILPVTCQPRSVMEKKVCFASSKSIFSAVAEAGMVSRPSWSECENFPSEAVRKDANRILVKI